MVLNTLIILIIVMYIMVMENEYGFETDKDLVSKIPHDYC